MTRPFYNLQELGHLFILVLRSSLLKLQMERTQSQILKAAFCFQMDSVDNFTLSNTPSRDEDAKSQVISRSRSPSTMSDIEPGEVSPPKLTHNILFAQETFRNADQDPSVP